MKTLIYLLIFMLSFNFTLFGNDIHINKSVVIESVLLLNAISDEPMFNQNYPNERQHWRALFSRDKNAQEALNIWLERGVGLAYLISGLKFKNIDEFLIALESPEKLFHDIESMFDEPLYEPALKYLKVNHHYLKVYLTFLKNNNFQYFWEQTYFLQIDEAILKANQLLKKINMNNFVHTFNLLTQSHVESKQIQIYITTLSGGVGYKLMGWRIGISTDKVSEIPLQFPHELCHHFNPSKENLFRLKQLAYQDPYYNRVFTRIYTDYREGLEEEFVYASGLYLSYISGMMSYKSALKHIKTAYFQDFSSGGHGVPITGIIFDQLLREELTLNFDYNIFIEKLFANNTITAGEVENKFILILNDIAGSAGVQIDNISEKVLIVKVWPNLPAANAGILIGDKIISINHQQVQNLSLDEIIDLIIGRPNEERIFLLKRNEQLMEISFRLK